jgi:osmotically-inducible protein OsmY
MELHMNKHRRIAVMVAMGLGIAIATALPIGAQVLDSPSTTPAQGVNRPADVIGDGQQQARDQATTTRVKAALLMDSELKTQTILVDTINGSVRLTGQVTSASNFDRAKDVLARVEGVKGVENLLVVKEVRPQ